MDQLQPAIRFVKAHHFWLECGLVVLIIIGGWLVVTSSMAKETKDRISGIESKRDAARLVAQIEHHPNDESHQGMDAIVAQLTDEVYDAWMRQYQIQEDVLVWPSNFSSEFLAIVEKYKPIEKVPYPITSDQQEPLDSDKRNFYRNYISDELPKLARIIGAQWTVGRRQTTARPDASQGLVLWNSSNQGNLTQTRFSWPNTTPTTLEVLYAQEDLWVLTALMHIIRNTNGEVTARYQSAIKTLEFIELGQDAIGVAGRVTRIGSSRGSSDEMMGSAGMAGGGVSEMDAPTSTDSEEGTGGAGYGSSGPGGAATPRGSDPGDHRYVDKNYQPLTAEKIRSAADSKNPEDAFLAVAKRIPVRMRMKIDQRKINRFLAECGSYKLPVEVHQVRINCKSGSTFGGRGAMGGGGGGGEMGIMSSGGGNLFGNAGAEDAGPEMDDPGMMGGYPGSDGAGMRGGRTADKLSDDSPWDVDLEVYGIIYIYNPVDRDKIGKKLDSASQNDSSNPASDSSTTPAAG